MSGSPRIVRIAWGVVETEGVGRHKDVKLWPGGGRVWDWEETGTRHRPGVQVSDIEELITHGARLVVIGVGMRGALQVAASTVAALWQRGVEVHVAATGDAVARYNVLAEAGRPVGALIHSTC